MRPAFRRLLTLVGVFFIAFVAVSALRTWRAGGDLRSLIPGLSPPTGQFRKQPYTLSDTAPLDLANVELLSRLNDEYAQLTAAVVPSVVSIDTSGIRSEKLFDAWSGDTQVRNYPTQGQGSGVIVTAQGHIVTNHHVIAGQKKIQITLHSGKTYSAQLVGEDPLLDIAVLKIDSDENFSPLKMGDSTQVKVGQIVMAVGNPFGLGETVTQGIVSAKERSLSDNQRDLFQTDAAINPGNSGGPLVNLRGEIIGINVAIYSPNKQNPGFQGVGFSIPSNDVKDSLLQILERGSPIRSFLGINQMRDVDAEVRSVLGYEGRGGAAVLNVLPGSPAQTAGLLHGDIVEAVNGEKIKTSAQLIALIQRAKVGEILKLDVWRNGESLRLQATLAESGASSPATQPPSGPSDQDQPRDPQEILGALGIEVRDLSVRERMQGYRGVVVTGLTETALAADLVAAGDLIYGVNGARIGGAAEFFNYLAASAAVQTTTLEILRRGRRTQASLPVVPHDG
jgi:Do/DeqQ family serine protease